MCLWAHHHPVYSGSAAAPIWPLVPFASLQTDGTRRDGNTSDQSASAITFHFPSGHGRCYQQQPGRGGHGCLCCLFYPSTWTAPAAVPWSFVWRSLLHGLDETPEPACHGHVDDTTLPSATQCPRTPTAAAGATGFDQCSPIASQYYDCSASTRRHRHDFDSGLSGTEQEKSGAHRNRRRKRQSKLPGGLRTRYKSAACRRGRRQRIERAYMLMHEGAQGAPASQR